MADVSLLCGTFEGKLASQDGALDRRYERWVSLAEQALLTIGALYEVERQAKGMSEEDRWRIRQRDAVPIAEKLHDWMLTQRELVPEARSSLRLSITASNAG